MAESDLADSYGRLIRVVAVQLGLSVGGAVVFDSVELGLAYNWIWGSANPVELMA